MIKKTVIAALIAGSTMVTSASAQGLFDFLDPCIEARNDFHDTRQNIMADLNRSVADVDTATPSREYRDAWFAAKRKEMRPVFDEHVAPTLAEYGVTDLDAAFASWFDRVMAQLDQGELDQAITANFRHELRSFRLKERDLTAAEFARQSDELGSACRMDAGNQALRVVLTTAMAPVDIVLGNIKAAEREANVVTGAVRATTGVSLRDIQDHGLAGGENSEVRKAGRAIAKVFGW
ncbi:MAG: hypothetical protein Tsb0019_21160 [Roseibium sp.]